MNPWNVNSVSDFNFLCCPECSFRSKEECNFENHALQYHPQSVVLFNQNTISNVKEEVASEVIPTILESWSINGIALTEIQNQPLRMNLNKVDLSNRMYDEVLKSRYICIACSETFPLSTTLSKHVGEAHPEEVVCNICDQPFPNFRALIEHNRLEHPTRENMINECIVCDFTCSRKSDLSQHINDEHAGPVVCNECGLVVDAIQRLLDHKVFKHTKPPKKLIDSRGLQFVCIVCSDAFANRATLSKHLTYAHSGEVECNECGEQFVSYKKLRDHKNYAHPDSKSYTYFCVACNNVYETKGELTQHENDVHAGAVECNECDQKFSSVSSLRAHKNRYHPKPDDAKYNCKACPFACPTFSKLTQHISEEHPGAVNCQTCGESFPNMKVLRNHTQSKHLNVLRAAQKISCIVCNYLCKNRKDYSKHLAEQHPGAVTCNECGKEFPRYKKLYWHKEKEHSREKFTCKICGEQFENKGNLRKHSKTHHIVQHFIENVRTADGQVKCPACPKVMPDNRYLAHYQQAHKSLPPQYPKDQIYKCTVCLKDFKDAKAMRAHSLEQHGENAQDDRVCFYCGYQGAIEAQTKDHIIKEHPERPTWTCVVCNEIFVSKPKYSLHIKDVHSGGITCPECDQYFDTMDKFRAHRNSTHLYEKCQVCSKEVAKSRINDHMEREHQTLDDQTYTCEHCDFVTHAKSKMSAHNYTKHNPNQEKKKRIRRRFIVPDSLRIEPGSKIIKCPECHSQMVDKVYVLHYRNLHKSLPPGFPEELKKMCQHCSKEFAGPCGLSLHLKKGGCNTNEEPDNDGTYYKNYKCEYCDNHLFGKLALAFHYRRKHNCFPPGEDTSKCVFCHHCGKIFAKQCKLNLHIAVIHDKTKVYKKPKPYNRGKKFKKKCPKCERVFASSFSLNDHIKVVHEKSFPFSCPHCDMKLPTANRLKTHIAVKHTRVECELCGVTLYNKFNYKEHQYQVHGILQPGASKCDQCDKIFLTKTSMDKHVKNKHQITVD